MERKTEREKKTEQSAFLFAVPNIPADSQLDKSVDSTFDFLSYKASLGAGEASVKAQPPPTPNLLALGVLSRSEQQLPRDERRP